MNSMENQPKAIVIGRKITIGEVAKVRASDDIQNWSFEVGL